MSNGKPAERLQVHAVTMDHWDDVTVVMGRRGDSAHCWCQYFQLRGKQC
jgi:hypothetical protein